MKFLVLAAACLSVAIAGPTRGLLIPDSAGPIVIEGEEIATDPALIPEDISVGPALIEEAQRESALVQVIININSKSHVIEIPVEDASIPEDISVGPALIDEADEIEPDNVNIVDEGISVGVPDLPLTPDPADIGTPELPGLDADNAQNIPDELN